MRQALSEDKFDRQNAQRGEPQSNFTTKDSEEKSCHLS